jgi:hypothetical protein
LVAGSVEQSRCRRGVTLGAQPLEHGDVVEVLPSLGLRPVTGPGGCGLHPDEILGMGDQNPRAQDLDGNRPRSQFLVGTWRTRSLIDREDVDGRGWNLSRFALVFV